MGHQAVSDAFKTPFAASIAAANQLGHGIKCVYACEYIDRTATHPSGQTKKRDKKGARQRQANSRADQNSKNTPNQTDAPTQPPKERKPTSRTRGERGKYDNTYGKTFNFRRLYRLLSRPGLSVNGGSGCRPLVPHYKKSF